MKTTVIEKFDANGKLTERITITEPGQPEPLHFVPLNTGGMLAPVPYGGTQFASGMQTADLNRR